jgi:hypothetical protein
VCSDRKEGGGRNVSEKTLSIDHLIMQLRGGMKIARGKTCLSNRLSYYMEKGEEETVRQAGKGGRELGRVYASTARLGDIHKSAMPCHPPPPHQNFFIFLCVGTNLSYRRDY